jgi:preprotein translocase subunit SecD
MRRNNLLRTIFIVASLLWAGYELYPTLRVSQLKNQLSEKASTLAQAAGLQHEAITDALNQGTLDGIVQQAFDSRSPDLLQKVQKETKALIALYDESTRLEPEALRRGLDLQGGTYLVYEVNLVKMFNDLAKNRDQRFAELMANVEKAAREPNADFFEVLQSAFDDAGIKLSRYWGSRAETDSKILDDMRKEAEDGVQRNLEILRNRIDQFGVSEPNIAAQGDRRIVVELAGIQSVERAKGIIGKTALLEFKLEKDPEVAQDVFAKINTWMKGTLKNTRPSLANGDTTKADTSASRTRKDTEVAVDDIFGTSVLVSDSGKADKDSTVLVDKDVFQDDPFYSLLAGSGRDVAVPMKNYRTVDRIINTPEVQEIVRNADAQFLWSKETFKRGDQEYYFLYLAKREPELTGEKISDARTEIGGGSSMTAAGQAVVSMRLNSDGAKIFARVTGANVNRRMPIVLDNRVASAPNINERIPSGSAYIEGMGDINEANDLAIVLRAGALRAPMEVIEERTVGPSLGQDSITQGTQAALIGLGLVILFMVIYYKLSGLLADVALMVNLVLLMAIMAAFSATLTLPGIAGIILTIGMAVDANVLIFERIREELRTGKTVRAAIDTGYDRAFWTIFDANLTTILTAVVLYQFGTGPIRGFAVTLIAGIAASMFTAIVMTRVIYDFVSTRRTLKTLSI